MASFGAPKPVPPPSPTRRTTRQTTRKAMAAPADTRPRSPTKPAASSRLSPSASASLPRPDGQGAKKPADRIRTFLRLRPAGSNAQQSQPYILVKNENEILMHAPAELRRPPQEYAFSRVFHPANAAQSEQSQSHVFQETCLPLIRAMLNDGQSGLYCTYGVSSSGKSYTIHGGSKRGEAGVLPRTLDTIFNSLGPALSPSNGSLRPRGLHGVEHLPPPGVQGFDPLPLPSLQQRLGRPTPALPGVEYEHEPTTVPVQQEGKYSVFVSYLEVYNEKLYDLLDVGEDVPQRSASNWSLRAGNVGDASSSHVLTRHALPLQTDPDAPLECKYPVGLSEHEVSSAGEARALLRRGELNRAVFGTMANRVSSRSHAVFTVRVIREHGPPTCPRYSTARMSIVDLAGSERMASTRLTDAARIKEAGNINRSLMMLGHCLEKLRADQSRGTGTKEVVPYNSSKLTMLLKPHFVQEGATVMIITANPFDGGYYENAQVLKLSAVVRTVTQPRHKATTTRSAIRPPSSPSVNKFGFAPVGSRDRCPSPSKARTPPTASHTSSLDPSATHELDKAAVTMIEDEGDDMEEQDPLVDLLLSKCEELQQRLYWAEQRVLQIETDVRAEMGDEMQLTLKKMSEMYQQRLQEEILLQQRATDRKLDLLSELYQRPSSCLPDSVDETDGSATALDATVHEPARDDTHSSMDRDGTQAEAMSCRNSNKLASPAPSPQRRVLPAVVPATHTCDLYGMASSLAGRDVPRSSLGLGGDIHLAPAGTSRGSLTAWFSSTAADERSVHNQLETVGSEAVRGASAYPGVGRGDQLPWIAHAVQKEEECVDQRNGGAHRSDQRMAMDHHALSDAQDRLNRTSAGADGALRTCISTPPATRSSDR